MTWSVRGRPVVVTGGNSGIGRATARALSERGALVTIAGRNESRTDRVASEIEAATGVPVETLQVDLADLASARQAAERFRSAHDDLAVLVNNAGGMFSKRQITDEGFEMTIATNYLGPFVFTEGLLDLLCRSAPSRVINVASSAHGRAEDGVREEDMDWSDSYRMMPVYGRSKLANILHARELQRRFGERGVTAYAMHPGLVKTDIGRGGDSTLVSMAVRFGGWRMKEPSEGADTVVWLVTSPELPDPRGGYFEDRIEARSSRHARDDAMARRLWTSTEQLLGIEVSGCEPT